MAHRDTKPLFEDVAWLHEGRIYTQLSRTEKVGVKLEPGLLTLTRQDGSIYTLTPQDTRTIRFEFSQYSPNYTRFSTTDDIFRIMFANPSMEIFIFPSGTSVSSQFASTSNVEEVFSDALAAAHFNVNRNYKGRNRHVSIILFGAIFVMLGTAAVAIIYIMINY